MSEIFCEHWSDRDAQAQGSHATETSCGPLRNAIHGASRKLFRRTSSCPKRDAPSEEITQRYYLHEDPHGDDILSTRDVCVERSPIRTDDSTSHADRSISKAWHGREVLTDHQHRANNQSTRKPWWCARREPRWEEITVSRKTPEESWRAQSILLEDDVSRESATRREILMVTRVVIAMWSLARCPHAKISLESKIAAVCTNRQNFSFYVSSWRREQQWQPVRLGSKPNVLSWGYQRLSGASSQDDLVFNYANLHNCQTRISGRKLSAFTERARTPDPARLNSNTDLSELEQQTQMHSKENDIKQIQDNLDNNSQTTVTEQNCDDTTSKNYEWKENNRRDESASRCHKRTGLREYEISVRHP